MLLFWPVAIAAFWSYPPLVPLVLAIGLSLHWPVIGWYYARAGIYITHAVIRAIACVILWNWWPSTRFTLLPFTVAAAYLLTAVAILIASSETEIRQNR
jgi:predicted membrane protein